MSGRARLYTITTARPRNGKQETKGVRGQSGAPVARRHASRQPQPVIATLSQIVRIVVFLKALPTPPTSVCGIAVALLEARVWASMYRRYLYIDASQSKTSRRRTVPAGSVCRLSRASSTTSRRRMLASRSTFSKRASSCALDSGGSAGGSCACEGAWWY